MMIFAASDHVGYVSSLASPTCLILPISGRIDAMSLTATISRSLSDIGSISYKPLTRSLMFFTRFSNFVLSWTAHLVLEASVGCRLAVGISLCGLIEFLNRAKA